MKKVLAVCGDSYMAAVEYPTECHGEHFTELLANKFDMELFTLARGGCSNNLIRLQIEEVIKESPSLVIIGTTNADRLEISIKNRKYNREDGILNFDYSTLPDLAKRFKEFEDGKINLLSLTLQNVLTQSSLERYKYNFPFYGEVLSQQVVTSLESYFLHCYDSGWKEQLDSWIISDGLELLHYHNIPFYIIPNNLQITNEQKFQKNIIDVSSNLNPTLYGGTSPCRFHTTTTAQYILADLWFTKIREDGLL